ncbi:MAG: hypothetical protein LBT41_03395 [Candidatus Methanoplasma sp.]|jgi:DNA-binding CsgD family transcriptional regulator|nr:hypothetical protein [Candidatus Methanoplasma sp.]
MTLPIEFGKILDRHDGRSEDDRLKYAMCMLGLQEIAGLSYKEARVYLSSRWESEEEIMDDLDLSRAAFRNLVRRSREKVSTSGFSDAEIFGDYALKERTDAP